MLKCYFPHWKVLNFTDRELLGWRSTMPSPASCEQQNPWLPLCPSHHHRQHHNPAQRPHSYFLSFQNWSRHFIKASIFFSQTLLREERKCYLNTAKANQRRKRRISARWRTGEGGRGWVVLAGSVHMPPWGLSRISASQWALQLWQWPGNGILEEEKWEGNALVILLFSWCIS